MKNIFKFLSFALLISLVSGCDSKDSASSSADTSDSLATMPSQSVSVTDNDAFVDYVKETKLDLADTSKIYTEVKVKAYVDGDTTHFVPVTTPAVWIEEEYLKARYNSIDTPESTGKVEEWGKTASYFTHDKLASAHSIIIQSDSNKWETDSTGGRYLVWVWYQPASGEDYRLLNLELIQNGLAKLKSATNYSLYDTFSAANMQAMRKEMKVYSNGKEKDENFYYGAAKSVTMKELRLNAKDYEGVKVSVEGLVTVYDPFSHMAYAQSYDVEDEKYYGMNFYAGFTKFTPLVAGNYLRLVGTLSWYAPDTEHPEYGSWQVSGLLYLPMNPDNEGSMKILEKNQEVVANLITADDLSKELENKDDTLTKGEKIESTYVRMENLTVKRVYTTESTDSTSNGALTLTCEDENKKQVIVRTSVLKKDDNTLLTNEDVLGKTIHVNGVVNKYNGNVQIHVFTLNDMTIA